MNAVRALCVLAALALSGWGPDAPVAYQGYVEGEFVRVASPIAGTLVGLSVERGSSVKAGDPLFTLEQEAEQAARREAEERVRAARARLANLEKGSLEYWRAQVECRGVRPLGKRVVAQIDGLAGFSGDALPVYNWYRQGGVTLVPGYHREELKGAQALGGALSLRGRTWGQLRLVARGGAGNVFATTDDITLDGLRWGVCLGVYHPSPIGPVSFEVGVRDDG